MNKLIEAVEQLETPRRRWVKRYDVLELLRQHEATQQPAGVDVAETLLSILRDVAELPDRTSPEDDPDMMLVHHKELEAILKCHLQPPAQQPSIADQGAGEPDECAAMQGRLATIFAAKAKCAEHKFDGGYFLCNADELARIAVSEVATMRESVAPDAPTDAERGSGKTAEELYEDLAKNPPPIVSYTLPNAPKLDAATRKGVVSIPTIGTEASAPEPEARPVTKEFLASEGYVCAALHRVKMDKCISCFPHPAPTELEEVSEEEAVNIIDEAIDEAIWPYKGEAAYKVPRKAGFRITKRRED